MDLAGGPGWWSWEVVLGNGSVCGPWGWCWWVVLAGGPGWWSWEVVLGDGPGGGPGCRSWWVLLGDGPEGSVI